MSPEQLRVSVLADSHGHLCDETLEVLSDSDLILHAGDIGGESVLNRLRAVAPVVAVVGNGDPDLPATDQRQRRIQHTWRRAIDRSTPKWKLSSNNSSLSGDGGVNDDGP